MKKFWKVVAILLGISIVVFLLTDIIEAQINPRLDTFVGIYCEKEFSEAYVVDRNSNEVIKIFNKKEVAASDNFNDMFKDWVIEHYKVDNPNNVMFNVSAVKDPSCSSS